MHTKPQLRLEATGRFLSMDPVGVHDNREPVRQAVEHCGEQLRRVLGH